MSSQSTTTWTLWSVIPPVPRPPWLSPYACVGGSNLQSYPTHFHHSHFTSLTRTLHRSVLRPFNPAPSSEPVYGSRSKQHRPDPPTPRQRIHGTFPGVSSVHSSQTMNPLPDPDLCLWTLICVSTVNFGALHYFNVPFTFLPLPTSWWVSLDSTDLYENMQSRSSLLSGTLCPFLYTD